jgi:hypothetical protein
MKRSLSFLISLIISCSGLSQLTLHPYVGLHISGDAEMYYVGPSLQAGADLQLRKKLLLTSYIHYFKKKVTRTESGGSFENGKFKTVTVAALIQFNTSKKLSRSFFLAGGFCVQKWNDIFISDYGAWNKQRKNYLPAIRVGYFFSTGKNKLTIELNGTGPYSYSDFVWQTVEILTQLSLGTRFIF